MTNGDQPIGLFALAEHRLAWIDARQRVLAQNIANADTPGYRARDVASFDDVLGSFGVEMARTSPLHLASLSRGGSGSAIVGGERAPDGNAVVLEDQMTKVADDENSQALTSNIWHSYMGMFMTALGHAG
jgi:flagellar basal-body rod protein FlgB